MYGPRYAAVSSVQATRKKSSSERTKCSLSSLKNLVYFGWFIFEPSRILICYILISPTVLQESDSIKSTYIFLIFNINI